MAELEIEMSGIEVQEFVSHRFWVKIDGRAYDAEDLCNLMDEASTGDVKITDKSVADLLTRYGVFRTVGGGFPAIKGRNFRAFLQKTTQLRKQIDDRLNCLTGKEEQNG